MNLFESVKSFLKPKKKIVLGSTTKPQETETDDYYGGAYHSAIDTPNQNTSLTNRIQKCKHT